MAKGSSKKKVLTRAVLATLGIPLIFFPGMVLASTLGWDWKHDLGELSKQGGFHQSKTIFPTRARVREVSDGDTIVIQNGENVRLIGIDAPERGEGDQRDQGDKGYWGAKDYLTEMVEGKNVTLEYDTYQEDKFGRLLAYVWVSCTTEIGCKDGERMAN